MLFRASVLFRAAVLLAVLLGALPARAQLATVRGRVADAADGQPMPGAAVVIENLDDGRRAGTAADANGFFVLARLVPGTYRLAVSFVGYRLFADTLALGFEAGVTVDVQLVPDEAALGEVVVESARETTAAEAAGLETIRPAALARVPLPGLSADLAAYLQTLPGVVAQGDRGGQLSVRGGTPTQNLVLLDGMPVFQPFHIVGFYSAFPADLIAFADVHAGGYGARYGGRLSSVIDVQTRNGNKQRAAGAASLAPFLGTVRLELPVVPERLSVLASVRESVIERLAPDLLGDELPYRFGDRFAKLHAFLSRTSSFSVTALQTFDRGDVADTEGRPSTLQWRNEAVGLHYVYLPEEYAALAQIRIYGSRLESRYRPFGAARRTADARAIGVEVGFIYYLGRTEVYAGLFGLNYGFDFDLGRAARTEFVTEGGLYADVPVAVSRRLRVAPGFRLHSFPSRSQTTFEPRLRAEFRPGGTGSRHVFSAAWGVYHQQITGLYNARDVTDAFVTWGPSPESRRIPQATHLLAGWSGPLRAGLAARVEGYAKWMDHLAFAEYSDLFEAGIRVDPVSGTAQGLDLRLERTRPALYLALTYGLARVIYERTVERVVVEEQADGTFVLVPTGVADRFPPPHDRRHQVGLVARAARGPYAVSARWHYGSGLPFTGGVGFFDFVPRTAAPDAPGTPVLVTDPDLYGARLPAYHRLDVAAERRFTSRRFEAVVQASVINAYDRANLFDFDLFADRRIDQLPLIPSLGIKVEAR